MDVLCMACKRSVPDEFPLCIQCGASLQGPGSLPAVPVRPAAIVAPPKPPAPPLAKPSGPDPEKLHIEAKARVMWGEERRAIRADLIRQGYSWREADRVLDEAARERAAHFRSTGFRDIFIGVCCLVLFFLVFGGLVLQRLSAGLRLVWQGKGLMVLFLLPPVGLFFVSRGLSRVLGGGKGEGSATDLEEED